MDQDISKAALAIEVAMDMLDVAKQNFDDGKYLLAFEQAKNSIRMSSSAVLFRDGQNCKNFSSVLSYLKKNYPMFPVDEWKKLECIDFEHDHGILLNVAQKILNIQKHQSKQAIMVAWKFLDSVHLVIGL